MRKDVRFGLTIGGSLLAVLVIWAAVFDRGVTDNKTPEVALAPATQPVDLTQGPVQTNNPQPGDVSSAGAATQPSGVADASAGSHDWDLLLATGGSTTQPSMLAASVPVGADMMAGMGSPGTTIGSADGATTRPSITAASTHKIQPGESFFSIAVKVYGDSKYYTRLEDANPTVNPNRLRVGTVINIPALSDTIATKIASTASKGLLPARAPVDSSKSYRVKQSDTLMAIARKLYGDGQAWEKIYDANRDVIGPNPARLRVDMVLRLPTAPTVALAN